MRYRTVTVTPTLSTDISVNPVLSLSSVSVNPSVFQIVDVSASLQNNIIAVSPSLANSMVEAEPDWFTRIVTQSGGYDYYTGTYMVTPKANTETVLGTQNKILTDNVTVLQVPYYETHNDSGYTVYIANEV